jgi:hypothetical protein
MIRLSSEEEYFRIPTTRRRDMKNFIMYLDHLHLILRCCVLDFFFDSPTWPIVDNHRVPTVLVFSSGVRIGTPPPAGECAPPFGWGGGGGGTHSLAGEGAGSPNSDEETDTLVL